MPKIELDTTYTNKAIICFQSKIFLSLIDIVQVFTPIDTINIYNVDTLTSFFFA